MNKNFPPGHNNPFPSHVTVLRSSYFQILWFHYFLYPLEDTVGYLPYILKTSPQGT